MTGEVSRAVRGQPPHRQVVLPDVSVAEQSRNRGLLFEEVRGPFGAPAASFLSEPRFPVRPRSDSSTRGTGVGVYGGMKTCKRGGAGRTLRAVAIMSAVVTALGV